MSRLNEAKTALEQYEQTKPGAYQSQYKPKIDNVLGKLEDMGEFDYDPDADTAYKQYRLDSVLDGLYNQSLGEYNAKKNGLQSQLSSLQQAENSAYNTYQQNLSNWYDGLEYRQNEYNNAYNADQQKKANGIQTATGIGQMIATAAPWIIKAIMMLL